MLGVLNNLQGEITMKDNKITFDMPEIEVIRFDPTDIITNSGDNYNNEPHITPTTPDFMF